MDLVGYYTKAENISNTLYYASYKKLKRSTTIDN